MRTRGTPEFWEILGQIALGESKSAKRSERARLEWKLAVLGRLKQRGIWLEDASPLGIYMPSKGGQRRRVTNNAALVTQIVREGYEQFVWPGVGDEKPKVWVIGKGVVAALDGLPGISEDRCIMQPGAARKPDVKRKYRDELRRLCRYAGEVAPWPTAEPT